MARVHFRWMFWVILLAQGWFGCDQPDGSWEWGPTPYFAVYSSTKTLRAVEPLCRVQVEGVGLVDVERDYLPRVVACENGAADQEALRAQAVAARSYLYYINEVYGSIRDGTSDQVYSCGRALRQAHRDAVEHTAGQVITYRGMVVAAFYVAGAVPSELAVECKPLPHDHDPWHTEQYVTYNQGLTGPEVIQTPLGYVDPYNHRNRGCQSQNGAHCLSREGWSYGDILRYYYGADVVLETLDVEGVCTEDEQPAGEEGDEGESEGEPVLAGADCCLGGAGREGPGFITADGPCFEMVCTGEGEGVGETLVQGAHGDPWGEMFWVAGTLQEGESSHDHDPHHLTFSCQLRWSFTFREGGAYGVQVAWPTAHPPHPMALQVPYTIHYSGGESTVLVEQDSSVGEEGQESDQGIRWHHLGLFPFSESGTYLVELGAGERAPLSVGHPWLAPEPAEGDGGVGDQGEEGDCGQNREETGPEHLWVGVGPVRIVPVHLEGVHLPDWSLPAGILSHPGEQGRVPDWDLGSDDRGWGDGGDQGDRRELKPDGGRGCALGVVALERLPGSGREETRLVWFMLLPLGVCLCLRMGWWLLRGSPSRDGPGP